jgi:hypothetical protein
MCSASRLDPSGVFAIEISRPSNALRHSAYLLASPRKRQVSVKNPAADLTTLNGQSEVRSANRIR